MAVALICVASSGCASFPTTRAEGGKPWLLVEGPHINLLSNQDEEDAREEAAQLELWWQAMAQAFPIAAPAASPAKVTALAVRSRWQANGVHPSIKGVFMGTSSAQLLYVGDPGDDEGEKITRHELGHAFIHARLRNVPRWLDEGLAKYLETASYDPAAGSVTWGGLHANTVREMAFGSRPGVSAITSDEWSAGLYGLLTFRAGILVHMLVNQHEAELDCYLAALSSGAPRQDTFAGCFPSAPKWNFEMDDYELNMEFSTRSSTVMLNVPPLSLSSPSDAQVHTWLAVLDVGLSRMVEKQFRSPYVDRYRGSLERALALDPTDPFAVATAVSELELEPARRSELTLGVVRAYPSDWRAWRLRAATPGLARPEAERACQEMSKLAPEGLDDTELSPCSRD